MPTPTKPSVFLDWTDGSAPKVLQPPSAQQTSGWTPSERPPYQYMNWLFWLTDQWIQWLNYVSGVAAPSAAENSNFNIAQPTAVYFCNVSGGGITGTLPASSLNLDYEVTIKNISIGSTNVVTITASGSDKIENGAGGGSITMAQGEYVKLKSDGAGNWWQIG